MVALIDNTNSKNLDLYSIMAEHDRSGFLLSYCLLSTATSVEIGKHTKALLAWAQCLCDAYGVIPVFTHVDKDMGEIGMLQLAWTPKIQLCWWHMCKAVGEQLDKKKLTTTPYNTSAVKSEFPFISLDFIPPGRADCQEHESGILTGDIPSLTEVLHQEDPNAVTICIPALTPVQPLLSTAPTLMALQLPTDKYHKEKAEGAEKLTIKLLP